MLRPLRAFARAFVDDIVVFSHTLEEHVQHLGQLFMLLRPKNVSLAPTKFDRDSQHVTVVVDGLWKKRIEA